MNVFLLLYMGISAVGTASGDGSRRGRVLCEGEACRSLDIPTGSLRDSDASRPPARLVAPEPVVREVPPTQLAKIVVRKPVAYHGNLPSYHQRVDRTQAVASDKVVFVPKSMDVKLRGLRRGDIIRAVVEQEIEAWPGVPTPIRAMALTSSLKGGWFIGEANLDRDSKRVLLSFTGLRIKNRESTYALKAAGLSLQGSVGVKGENVTHNDAILLSEFASSGATAAKETLESERSVTGVGGAVAATALAKTTERIASNIRERPQYTRIPAFQEIQIIVQEDPMESGT